MTDDGWIEWKGERRPVHPDKLVDYQTQCGSSGTDPAGNVRWQHTGSGGDIVRYRIHQPETHVLHVPIDEPPPEEHPSAPPAPSGLNGSYYDVTLADGRVVSCNDVIDALGLNFNRGEAFKALWRMGRKPGVAEKYDAEKVVYYGTRELKRAGG